MASFTEQATLKVIDQSSKQISKINAELKKLFATADKLRSRKIDLAINDRGVTAASANIKKLTADLRALQNASRAISIKVSTSQAQREIDRLRSSAQRPINAAMRTTGRTAGGIGTALGTTSRFGVHVLGGTVGLTSYSVAALAHAIGRAGKEGTIQADVAATSLDLNQLKPAQRTAADAAISQIVEDQKDKAKTPSGQLLNRAQVQSLYSESLGVTRGDTEGARHLTTELMEMIKLGVAAGQSLDKAREGAINFGKAAETMGRLTTGDKYDPTKAAAYFDLLRKIAPDVGSEFTGSFVRQATKYLRASRFGLDDAGLATVLFLAEESGSTAAVGYNQLLQQVSGTRIQKKQLANLKKMGLITSQEAEAGKVGDKTITELVGGTAVDEKTQTSNLALWVSKNVIPQMKKMGLDPNKPADAAKMARLITSDRTATDALTTLINRSDELAQQAKLALERRGDKETVGKILSGSTVLAGTSVQSQFQSLLGETVSKLEPVLLPVMKTASSLISDATEQIRKASPEATVAGGVVAAGATAAAVYGIMKAAGPLGVVSGVAGLADEKSRPMSLAALALQGAAADLSSAADKLKGGTGLVPETLGGDASKPGDKTKPKPRGGRLGRLGGGLGRAGGLLLRGASIVGAATILGELAYDLATTPEAEAARNLIKAENAKKLTMLQSLLSGIEQEQSLYKDTPVSDAVRKHLAAQAEKANKLRTDIELLQAEDAPPKPVKTVPVKPTAADLDAAKPSTFKPITEAIDAAQPLKVDTSDMTRAIVAAAAEAPKPVTVEPIKPQSLTAAAAAVPPTADSLTALIPQLTATTNSINLSVAGLATAGTSFATVFQTGSAQITTAGTAAADIISSGAAAAGQRYGNAAAAAIAAATANISVNVNANVSNKAPTGAQKAD